MIERGITTMASAPAHLAGLCLPFLTNCKQKEKLCAISFRDKLESLNFGVALGLTPPGL